MEQLKDIAGGIVVPIEDTVNPEVLRPHVGAEILPLGVFGIGGRLERGGAYVGKSAGHSDAIRLDQRTAVVVIRVVIVSNRIPLLGRSLIEIGIGEKSQPDDSRSP